MPHYHMSTLVAFLSSDSRGEVTLILDESWSPTSARHWTKSGIGGMPQDQLIVLPARSDHDGLEEYPRSD